MLKAGCKAVKVIQCSWGLRHHDLPTNDYDTGGNEGTTEVAAVVVKRRPGGQRRLPVLKHRFTEFHQQTLKIKCSNVVSVKIRYDYD